MKLVKAIHFFFTILLMTSCGNRNEMPSKITIETVNISDSAFVKDLATEMEVAKLAGRTTFEFSQEFPSLVRISAKNGNSSYLSILYPKS